MPIGQISFCRPTLQPQCLRGFSVKLLLERCRKTKLRTIFLKREHSFRLLSALIHSRLFFFACRCSLHALVYFGTAVFPRTSGSKLLHSCSQFCSLPLLCVMALLLLAWGTFSDIVFVVWEPGRVLSSLWASRSLSIFYLPKMFSQIAVLTVQFNMISSVDHYSSAVTGKTLTLLISPLWFNTDFFFHLTFRSCLSERSTLALLSTEQKWTIGCRPSICQSFHPSFWAKMFSMLSSKYLHKVRLKSNRGWPWPSLPWAQ